MRVQYMTKQTPIILLEFAKEYNAGHAQDFLKSKQHWRALNVMIIQPFHIDKRSISTNSITGVSTRENQNNSV